MKTTTQITPLVFTALIMAASVTLAYYSHQIGKRQGHQQGREEYHEDLLFELQAKKGRPILVYPPDNMNFEESE